MPASTILLLDQDADGAQATRLLLTRLGHVVTVSTDVMAGVQSAAEHALVIVDVLTGDDSPEDAVRRLRAFPASSSVPVLGIAQTDDVEARVRLLEAGADDVMARPYDPSELEARVEALLVRFRNVPAGGTKAEGGGGLRRVAVFFSPKGGVGTTTLAVNAAVAAAERRPGRVALLDLVPQFGQVATHLDLRHGLTVTDLVHDTQAFVEPEFMRTYLHVREGLAILGAPPRPDPTEPMTAERAAAVVGSARRLFDVVIVDAGSTYDARATTLIEAADILVVTLYPEIAALNAVRSFLEAFHEEITTGAGVVLVVNHLFARDMLKVSDIEATLGARVTLEIPYEPVVFLRAVNEGIPVVAGAPRSAPSERLRGLAEVVAGA
ncbi:MAG: CpaE family protein, partial [Candidatus Limnocylindrales bacterium]